jgi:hypothetical protein
MGWRAFPDHKRRILFFWSQKSACTTLFHMLAENVPVAPDSKQYFIQHSIPIHMAQDLIRAHGFRSVAVVRHPVPRAISAFLNKFVVHSGRPLLRHEGLEPFARELHLEICAAAGRAPDANRTSFEEFLAAVATQHARRADPWERLNGHWDTQAPPRLAEAGFDYEHVVHVEALDSELAAVASGYGMRYTPAALNRTAYASDPPARRYLGGTPAQDLARLPYRPENFVNPLTLAMIELIYASDYRLYGYPPLPEGWSVN